MRIGAAILPALGLILGMAARAPAQVLALQSPFGEPSTDAARMPRNAALELRGIMSTASGDKFCIYNAATDSSVWAGVAEDGNPFVVETGDSAREEVTVRAGGRVIALRLRNSKVESLRPVVLVTWGGMTFAAKDTTRMPGEPRAPQPAQAPVGSP